ncbi:MAG: protein-L-isoaspartate(D-aspartate) O-methyltransferase [Rhodospirillaceae bacterium]
MTLDLEREELMASLRRLGIGDERVLAAIERVPRQHFLAEAFQDRAYRNLALPIGHQQTISQPWVVARMTEALELTDRSKVLEIGTGCGYQSVILSLLCRRLYTVERHKGLMDEALRRFKTYGLTNITAKLGDGSLGWPEQAPFERIIVTAAADDIPPVLLDQLADGGIMIVPVGHGDHEQRLYRVDKGPLGLEIEDMGEVRFVPLVAGVAEGAA